MLASPLIAALLQRRTLLGPQGSTVGLDRWLVPPVATMSLGVGLIHAAVAGDHFKEDTLSGLFFVIIAVFQLGWAVIFASRPQRSLAALGLLVNSLVVAVWLVTRTVGLPFGARPGLPEAIAGPDLLATIFEILILAGTATLVLPSWREIAERTRAKVADADLLVVLALIIITMTTSYVMADTSINGGHGDQGQAGLMPP